jgi:hypothetical protein
MDTIEELVWIIYRLLQFCLKVPAPVPRASSIGLPRSGYDQFSCCQQRVLGGRHGPGSSVDEASTAAGRPRLDGGEVR